MRIKLINIIQENDFLKGKKTKPLVDAILKRNPVTFYYSGPKTPPKTSVKTGVRIRAEIVALGLSKGGNLIVRAYVQPPSVSKKGYKETGWRTFRIDRMSNINVLLDEVFDEKRPKYKDGDESNRGPMTVTYVTTNWIDDELKTPTLTKPEKIEPIEKPEEELPQPEPIEKPEEELPQPEPIEKPEEELPQPKPIEKPSPLPQPEPVEKPSELPKVNLVDDVYKTITFNTDQSGKFITPEDFEKYSRDLYTLKYNDWKTRQKDIGGQIKPGMGTRKNFEISSKVELSNLLKNNNVKVKDKQINLNEDIKKIKTLMFKII
jgi:hypothetical protein